MKKLLGLLTGAALGTAAVPQAAPVAVLAPAPRKWKRRKLTHHSTTQEFRKARNRTGLIPQCDLDYRAKRRKQRHVKRKFQLQREGRR